MEFPRNENVPLLAEHKKTNDNYQKNLFANQPTNYKYAINDSVNSSTQVQLNAPAVAPVIDRGHILNVNVGILGHVDSGKTSLVKSLSTHLSTAALDKNPQSQQRGITLDLGI
jgi:hypothetical protein